MALKDEMPKTADYVAAKRSEWGNAHVTAMVRAGMAGQRNAFYALEMVAPGQYRSAGAPFDMGTVPDDLAVIMGGALMGGGVFAGMMRPPGKIEGGAHGQS